jgi:NAD(P)-dependent dehydrogenase (short-subunit alcohol dehydrogenase family)
VIHDNVYPAIDPARFVGKLKGRNVVVTGSHPQVPLISGSARGIGQATAIAFAKAGADVAIIDLKLENLAGTKKACESHGVKASAYVCDVTKDHLVKSTVAQIEKDMGPIYCVVNNAGGVSTRPFHMETMERFWYQIELNFKAVCPPRVINDRPCCSLMLSFRKCVSARKDVLLTLYGFIGGD